MSYNRGLDQYIMVEYLVVFKITFWRLLCIVGKCSHKLVNLKKAGYETMNDPVLIV